MQTPMFWKLVIRYPHCFFSKFYFFFIVSTIFKSPPVCTISVGSLPSQGSWEILWMSSNVMGMGLLSHKYPSCNRQRNCLMTNILIRGWWKCGIVRRWSSATSCSFPSTSFGYSVVMVPSILRPINSLVSRWGNFSVSARSQSSNFIEGIQPNFNPSSVTPLGRDGVMSFLWTKSKYLGTWTFPSCGGTYLGIFTGPETGGISSSISSSGSISSTYVRGSSSSSSL